MRVGGIDRSTVRRTAAVVGALLAVVAVGVIGLTWAGIGGMDGVSPQVAFEFEFRNDGTVVVTHGGGDPLVVGENTNRVYITSSAAGVEPLVWIGPEGGGGGLFDGSERLQEGDTSPAFEYGPPGATVRIVWEDAGNDSAVHLGSEEAPGGSG